MAQRDPSEPAPASARRSDARERLELGQLNNHLGYFLRRLQISVFQDFIEALQAMKVRPAQYSVLLMIEANPGRSQSAIGRALGIERAGLVRLLHVLEKRKWISRRASSRDARSQLLFLSPEGEKALDRIKALATKHEARVAQDIGVEKHRQLLALLRDLG